MSSVPPHSLLISFVSREHIRRLARKRVSNNPESSEFRELGIRRRKLEGRLIPFRKERLEKMGEGLPSRFTLGLPCYPEDEVLPLPLAFTATERLEHNMIDLALKQAKLIKGKLFDIIRALRTDVRALTAAGDRKVWHARGQDANTRSMSHIRELQSARDEHLQDYNFLRDSLEGADCLEPGEWPKLSIADTYRKSTEKRQQPGASRFYEGRLWTGVELPQEFSDTDANTNQERLDAEEDPILDIEGFSFGMSSTFLFRCMY